MSQRKGKQRTRASFVVENLIDLRGLGWWELYREFQKPSSAIRKLAVLRRIAENYWQGSYKNGVKREVEIFLRGFLSGQDHVNLLMVIGRGYMDDDARRKATREVILVIYAFLSRCKVDGATQGLMDAVKRNPPDEHFIKDVDRAVESSRL